MEGYPTTQWISRRPPILLKRNWPCWPGSHGAHPQVVSVWAVFSCCTKCSPQSKSGRWRKREDFPKGLGHLFINPLLDVPVISLPLRGSALFIIRWVTICGFWSNSDTPWNIKSVAEGGCQDPSPRLDSSLQTPHLWPVHLTMSLTEWVRVKVTWWCPSSSVTLDKLFKCSYTPSAK